MGAQIGGGNGRAAGVRGSRRPSRLAVAVCLAGLLLTGGLAWTTQAIYERNEQHLLKARARELGLVLTSVVPSIQTPLASAAELADATDGNAQRFRAFMSSYVGKGGSFASVSLWRLYGAGAAPTVVLGEQPVLADLPAHARSFFAGARGASSMRVIGLLDRPSPRLGYEYDMPGVRPGFAVYMESVLPKDRRSTMERDSAFSDLSYALYLGHHRDHSELLLTSLRHLPIRGRRASYVIPFGDSALTLVVTPNGSLGGEFFQDLPWIIAGAGALIALAAALMTERLVRRRHHAERLAGDLDQVAAENARMYTEQRSIAQTLQQALLPDALPEVGGLRTSARYVPAAAGVDVGGDWYDIVRVADTQALLVIGDVSGQGIAAATTMALLRHATLAYAEEGLGPADMLGKLSDFVARRPHDYFATVLCALIDLDFNRATVASAGHLPPLLVAGGAEGRFVGLDVGVPIGVPRAAPYGEVLLDMPPRAIFLAYTDGLVERRGESIDVSLERMRAKTNRWSASLDELVQRLAQDVSIEKQHDDTAIVGIQWPA